MPSEKGHQYRYYASVVENRAPETLVLPSLSFSYEANGLESSVLPQKTVEQPSMLTFWGENAGTITLNHWLQISSSFHPKEESVFSMAVQRDIEEPDLFARLIHSQHAIEDDVSETVHAIFTIADLLQEFSRHTYLYEDLIQCWGPPQTVDLVQEIRDLANCLAGCDFWDLSLAKNQVIGEFISGKLSQNVAYRFLHQILLSIETFHRLELLDSDQRSKLLTEIPPKVTWDLLAAKVWLKNVKVYSAPGHIHGLYFINEPEQVSVLKEFIRKAKWPTAADAFWVLDHREERQDIYRDQHFLSWISGIVLPGPSTSWLLMNSLLSLEPELIHILDDLDSKHQNTGFRYRSFTYWYRECIMGKVLAAAKGVTEVAGWICACPPSLDLDTFQLVHIAQNEVQHQMKSKHVKRMLQRTRPLGPLSIDQCCPSEYALPVIGRTRSVHDIRIQALNFVPDPAKRDDTSLFFSAITFAIGCRNFSLSLRYNVSFIAAVHCSSGPHLLYKKYKYESVKITTLADMSIWGHADADEDFVYRSVDGISKYDPKNGLSSSAQGEPHCVLVVEAFGSADAEVMARAWCANLGLSAIIADVGTTCPACSIREAYAACVSVSRTTFYSRPPREQKLTCHRWSF